MRIKANKIYLDSDVSSQRWYFMDIYENLRYLGHKEYCLYQGEGMYSCVFIKEGKETRYQQYINLGEKANSEHTIGEWDFTKLTAEESIQLKSLYNAKDIDSIISLHNEKQLSPHVYCCGVKHSIINYLEHAIKLDLL